LMLLIEHRSGLGNEFRKITNVIARMSEVTQDQVHTQSITF
jgi:hypothetical protein